MKAPAELAPVEQAQPVIQNVEPLPQGAEIPAAIASTSPDLTPRADIEAGPAELSVSQNGNDSIETLAEPAAPVQEVSDVPAMESSGITVDSDANSVKVYGDPATIRQTLRSQGINFDGAEIDGGLSFGKKLESRIRPVFESAEIPAGTAQTENSNVSLAAPAGAPQPESIGTELGTSDSAVPELPAILRITKKKHIAQQVKQQGIKETSPGYTQAIARLEEQYEADIDRAQAGLTFEQFNSINDDSPESVNRQAYKALREEFGLPVDMQFSKTKKMTPAIENAVTAIRTVATTQTDVQDAVVRDDIGSVDFVWGDEGAEPSKSGKRKGAKGIAHIIEARMRKDGFSLPKVFQLLDNIAETVATGNIVKTSAIGDTQKTAISDGKHTAWLVKSGDDNHWLLTGWEEVGASGELSEGHDSSQPTSLKPTPTRLEDGAEAREQSIAENSTTEQAEQPDNKNPDIQFARQNTIKAKPARGVNAKLAKQMVANMMKRMNGAAGIKVVVLETQAEAEKLWQMSLSGDLVRGAYNRATNTAYVIAENVKSLDELREVVAHEVIGHGGLQNVISKADYTAFIERLKQTRNNRAFAGQWAQIDNDYEGISENDKAEELFAYFVQNKPVTGPVKFWWNAPQPVPAQSIGISRPGESR
ncbi:MAG: hypothetical protein U5L02_13215 [Rheinheimera sp.]|nr:hypothetical protein [Rheinheimera sp.]